MITPPKENVKPPVAPTPPPPSPAAISAQPQPTPTPVKNPGVPAPSSTALHTTPNPSGLPPPLTVPILKQVSSSPGLRGINTFTSSNEAPSISSQLRPSNVPRPFTGESTKPQQIWSVGLVSGIIVAALAIFIMIFGGIGFSLKKGVGHRKRFSSDTIVIAKSSFNQKAQNQMIGGIGASPGASLATPSLLAMTARDRDARFREKKTEFARSFESEVRESFQLDREYLHIRTPPPDDRHWDGSRPCRL